MSEHNDVHIGHGEPPDPTILGNDVPRLRTLSEMDDVRVADHDPDIRGWVVRDANGETIGKVHDLVFETDTRQVRYFDVAITGTASSADRHVLVPIGAARLNDDSNVVTIGALTREEILELPPYDHATFSRDSECELLGQLQGLAEPAADTPRFYEHAVFGTQGFWGGRRDPEALMTYQLIAIAEGLDEEEAG
jgi:hypothetical protein